mmetsp:Transcript_42616/g.49824  ORF Transcript_42616/g.49824 Transcript_42616/m.49824 type:complete len:81 (-) Transcript_42616:1315-1557(-)
MQTQIFLVARNLRLLPMHEHVVDPAVDLDVDPHDWQAVEAMVLENVWAGHDKQSVDADLSLEGLYVPAGHEVIAEDPAGQ